MNKKRGNRSEEYKKRNRSPEFFSWAAMNQRCRNPSNDAYKNYGGRGITVCKRWQGVGGFKNFLEDMGERPHNMTLDRIDFNGHYCKENCRWADIETQNKNRRCSQQVVGVKPDAMYVDDFDSLAEVGINI